MQSLAATLEADCVLLRQSKVDQGLTGQYLVRRRLDRQDFLEIRSLFNINVDNLLKVNKIDLIYSLQDESKSVKDKRIECGTTNDRFRFLSFRRVAVVGNVDAGKSTLLGVLTHGELDNGRGLARQKLFRHKHEAETGRTSSVGNDILGFDSVGERRCVLRHNQPCSSPVISRIIAYSQATWSTNPSTGRWIG